MKIINKIFKSITSIPQQFFNLVKAIGQLFLFFVLLQFFLLNRLFRWLSDVRLVPVFLRRFFLKISNGVVRIMGKLDQAEDTSISQKEIIRMSIQNMNVKKARTAITVGGMSIGIGAIVFLVSVGYGLQNLVISRIARLEEMKQAEVMPNEQGQVYITDKTISDFNRIDQVTGISPLISLVGRVNFKNSVTDVVVHGVTTDYLKNSAMNPVEGSFFESNEIAKIFTQDTGKVAGAKTKAKEIGQIIQPIFFTVNPDMWLRVRSGPSTDSPVIGYTRRVEGEQDGEEVWGGYYESEDGAGEAATDSNGETLGRWINTDFPIWEYTGCDADQEECESGYEKLIMEEKQTWEKGYVAEIGVSLQGLPDAATPEVLGEATTSAETSSATESASSLSAQNATQSAINLDTTDATGSALDQEILELLNATPSSHVQEVKRIPLNEKAQKQAVINESMAQILGEKVEDIVGKEFKISFVAVGEAMSDSEEKKVESETESYKIVAVIPGSKNPVVWVPFIDLRSLGINRFSQARVTVAKAGDLPDVRSRIEALGYSTSSVADTVAQVKGLFTTARLALGTLGMVALAVASLGMFNTLTVSLLERTREVGVLKSMGMKSYEVKNLFLTESMVMGFFGGMLGIILGIVAGKFLGLILSVFAIVQGVGFINISSLPIMFGVAVVFLSLLVGFITGHYPAKRATKISALNALRYE